MSASDIDRRAFVAGMAGTALAAWADRNQAVASPASRDYLDEAYKKLMPYAAGALEDGGISHAPMVAEALNTLGRGDAFNAWFDKYRRRRRPARSRSAAPFDQPHSALGRERDPNRWSATFRAQLGGGWKAMLRRWLPVLMPGLAGGAAHGLIRTSHAVRAVKAKNSPQRVTEVADALGLWAAWYQPLPGNPGQAPKVRLPTAAIAEVPSLPLNRRGRGIGRSFRRLHEYSPFAGAIDLAAPGDNVGAFMDDLLDLGSKLYLINAEGRTIAWAHAVTAPTAAMVLAPYLDPGPLKTAAQYAWQLIAALHASFSPARLDLDRAGARVTADRAADLPGRAVQNGDEHVIKLVEACLRGWRRTENRVFLAAATDICSRL